MSEFPFDDFKPDTWSFTELPFVKYGFRNHSKKKSRIEKRLKVDINSISKNLNQSNFVILLSSFKILLYRYCQLEEIVIGASNELPNLMIISSHFYSSLSVIDCITMIDENIKAAKKYHFDSIKQFPKIIFIDTGDTNKIGFLEDNLNSIDLIFFVSLNKNDLFITCDYSSSLVTENIFERLLDNFENILKKISPDNSLPCSYLPFLSEEEIQKIIKFSQAKSKNSISKNNLIHSLFEQSVALNSNEPAILYYNQCIEYNKLNGLANQLALNLIDAGLHSDSIVAILLDRTPLFIISILAILKAGSAYLPLDPTYPDARNSRMLEDSHATILLTIKKYDKKFQLFERKKILIDEDQKIWQSQGLNKNPEIPLADSSLAYVLYTSGTTGQPKGVSITHQNCVQLLNWGLKNYSLEQISGVLASTSFSFDLSIFEIFLPLIAGKKIILVDNIIDIKILQENIYNQITLINTVPTAISILLDLEIIPLSVNTINLAGEHLPRKLVDRIYNIPTIHKVYNLYGPTETTTYITCALLPKKSNLAPTVGKPIQGNYIFLLDKNLQPVPLGVTGEIYIGGGGVGQGYYNNQEETKNRFIEIPIFDQYHQYLFKTNDLAYYNEAGDLQFLGRIDNQIKLHGFRIELEEIESILKSHLDVQQAVVLPQYVDQTVDYLIGFIVLNKNSRTTFQVIHDYLTEQLPSHMLPRHLLIVDQIPLNKNGKPDKMKLSEASNNMENIEEKIASVWKSLLNIDEINSRDNFYGLGGHSLLLIDMQVQLENLFQVKIQKVDFFKYPTIAELTNFIKQKINRENSQTIQSRNHIDKDKQNNRDIAIIGMSCRFPGASNIEKFWHNLSQGIESLATDTTNYENFDFNFFNYTYKEAQLLDPQQRIFLECAWEALEDAGYCTENNPYKIGVFSAIEKSDYLENVLRPYINADNIPNIGNAEKFLIRISNEKDFLSTRISYKLNLTGPSINVQTACSSSLVAIHLARQSLIMGECDIALVGGVSLHCSQENVYSSEEGLMISPDGHCRSFDAGANGTIFSNGAGIVVLKSYQQAKVDRDYIYTVLKGSAINNDGIKKMSFTAPSIQGQAEVISMALQAAQLTADSISYVEAHGSATPLGDPIEVAALTQAFAGRSPLLTRCALGSVKSNIGHLDNAAGIAGLIKTALSLKNKQIPPSLHFTTPNPEINFSKSLFYVCQQLTPWENFGGTRCAGVSSFGIGGTNAHAILSEAPELNNSSASLNSILCVLPLSAKSWSALKALTEQYILFLEKNNNQLALIDICYTATLGRVHFAHRIAVIGSQISEIIYSLKTWLEESENVKIENARVILNYFPYKNIKEAQFIENLAKRYIKSQEINWQDFFKNFPCQRIPLPTYPFQRQRCWADIIHSEKNFSILGKKISLPFSNEIRFENTFNSYQPAYNSHHRLFGEIVVPGSSHLAVFIAALSDVYPHAHYYYFSDLVFLNPFLLLEGSQNKVQVIINAKDKFEHTLSMVSSSDEEKWLIHIEGKVNIIHSSFAFDKTLDKLTIKSQCRSSLTGEEFYKNVWVPGVDTGPSFRWLKHIWFKAGEEAIACAVPPENLEKIKEKLHPGLIETCFQLLNACWNFNNTKLKNQGYIYVPFSIKSLNYFSLFIPGVEIWSYTRIIEIKSQSIIADMFLFDSQGKIILEILGFEVRKLYQTVIQKKFSSDHKFFNHKSEVVLQSATSNLLKEIDQSSSELRKEILQDHMKHLLKKFLGTDISLEIIDLDRGFIEYGLDSLMSIELRNQLQNDLNLKLSPTFAFDYPTINQVVDYLLNIFNGKNTIGY